MSSKLNRGTTAIYTINRQDDASASDSYGWRRAWEKKAFIALENGAVFHGYSIGADVDTVGEAVFNTGMTGYQEILSDPSYAGQLICLTAPEIGNTGINFADMESRNFHAAGLLVHNISKTSNWRSHESLEEALVRENIPALAGIDTRALATALRENGSMKAYIAASGKVPVNEAISMANRWEGLAGKDYVSKVTSDKSYNWDPDNLLTVTYPHEREMLPPADYWVVAYDFGIKWNILRCLRRAGMDVTVVPAHTPAESIIDLRPDGVFLSNGPADPAALGFAAKAIEKLLGRMPVLGICLGHQLLGMALGGKTYKLPFGHHGCNHPVKDLANHRTLITSQNHNYAVDPDSLPVNVDITHLSLNDQSVEGLASRDRMAMSVQYHPEAAPGPHDAATVFKQFYDMIRQHRK